MAKTTITLLTDDLDGSEADRTVDFGIDGVAYTIDLSDKNIGKLRKLLDPYLAVGTRVGRAGRETPPAARSPQDGQTSRRKQKGGQQVYARMGREEWLRDRHTWTHPPASH